MDVNKGENIFSASTKYPLKKVVFVLFSIAKLLSPFKILSHGGNDVSWPSIIEMNRACVNPLARDYFRIRLQIDELSALVIASR
jgi:hypothetical protein